MRVVLYLRVSTTEQAEEGYSIRAQRSQLLEYAKFNEYEVTEIYIDEGLSAKDMNRPALKQLLADAKAGLFDAVLVYKLDRFTRSARDLYDMLDYLAKFKVGFISKQERFDTTSAMGRLMIGVIAVIAQFERELISERVRMGQEQRTKEGKKQGKYPFGYSKQGELIESEAEQVRMLRNLYMDEQLGFKSIAMRMIQLGYRRGAFDWRATTVALTLENPFYAGIIEYGGKMSNGRYPQRSRDLMVDVIRAQGDHEPIWTEDEFNEHIRMMRRRTKEGFSRKMDYWFTGLLRCGRCGGNMFGRLTTKKSRKSGIVRTPYYICNNRKENSICTQPIFSQHHVEHLVLKYIEDLRTRPDLSRIEQRKLAAKKVNVDKLKAKLKRDLEGIKERLKKWQYMFVEELITAEDMRKRLDEESEREKDLLAQLANLQVNEKESTEQQEQLFSIIEYWPALGDMDKKALLNATFDEIKLCTDEVKPKGVKNKYFDASVEIKYR